MLDRLRSRLKGALDGVGRSFASISGSPSVWTSFGVVGSLAAGAAFYLSGRQGELLGGILILVAGFFDIVDGAVARVTGTTSRRGAFLDSTLDRVAEVAVYVGVLGGSFSPPLAVLLALAGSLLVSYTRAKGDALGVALSGVGIGERSERLLVLAVAALLGFTYWGVLVVIAIAWLTFIERAGKAFSEIRETPPKV